MNSASRPSFASARTSTETGRALPTAWPNSEDCALRVLATVASAPTRDRVILDAGTKALTSDPAAGVEGHGLIVEYPEADVRMLNEEHGIVDVSRCQRPPRIGEQVSVVPNHACGTTNLYDELVLHRDGMVVSTVAIRAAADSLARRSDRPRAPIHEDVLARGAQADRERAGEHGGVAEARRLRRVAVSGATSRAARGCGRRGGHRRSCRCRRPARRARRR